ncbi:MAG: hypothetical protein D6800_14580, partial [Candidatus Zixiibacteriota bacterium]
MGRFLIILMLGLSITSSLVVYSRNSRVVDSAQLVATHFSNITAKNAANSGVYMALNQLYLDSNWRTGYSNIALNQDSLTVSLEDNGTNPSIPPFRIKITAMAANPQGQATSEAMTFDGQFHKFAVWAKDSVRYVTTKDSSDNIDPNLQIEYAPFMPEIDYAGLVAEAATQGHVQPGPGHF